MILDKKWQALLNGEFSKAYFKLDPLMSDYLSEDRKVNEDEADVVAVLISNSNKEADTLGFSSSFMKTGLKDISTYLVEVDDSSAKVIVKAKRKRSLNFIFEFIGCVFDLGDTYEVNEIIDLVNEDGNWKVTGNPFQLPI